jgi:hypothetical protein
LADDGEKKFGWKEPTIVLGLLALIVAVLTLGRDLTNFILPGWEPNPTTTPTATAPLPSPTATQRSPSIGATQVKQRFIAAANAACVNRFHQNVAIANQVGLMQRQEDFATQMVYMEGTVDAADNLVAAISALERPAGDEQRIETMLSYLAESNLSLNSAIDNYKRFGPQTPKFQQDIDDGANREKKWNSAAAVYGLRECA